MFDLSRFFGGQAPLQQQRVQLSSSAVAVVLGAPLELMYVTEQDVYGVPEPLTSCLARCGIRGFVRQARAPLGFWIDPTKLHGFEEAWA